MSMFLIDPEDPWHPQLVGTPAATLGETPITVAYSPELKTGNESPYVYNLSQSLIRPLACVANAGAVAGVTCFSVDSVKGLTALGPTRFVPQTEDTDPTTPPVGPLVLISDIVFNPSSTALLITVRSNGAQPGLIYAWPVVDGQVSTNAVVSSFADLALIFSLNFLSSDTRVVATNPHLNSPGAAYLDISYPSLEITVERIVTIPDQKASCWVVLVPQYDDVIVVDALQPNITIVSPETGAVKGVFHFDAPPPGAADSKLDRSWFYTLTDSATAPQVLVFDTTPLGSGGLPQLVQSYDIASALGPIPAGAGDFGLAIYPSY